MYNDLVIRQTFNYATPISCENKPQSVKALDIDNYEHYVLIPKPILRATPMLFEPKEVQPTKSPNTFPAQGAEISSNAELPTFWNHVPFTKHSDSTPRFLKKPPRMFF